LTVRQFLSPALWLVATRRGTGYHCRHVRHLAVCKGKPMLATAARFLLLLLALCAGPLSDAHAEETQVQRYLYVVAPGIRNYLEFGGAGILVFDIDAGHRFVKRIATPASQVAMPANIKGVCAHAATGRLFFTTTAELFCVDLVSEQTLWHKALPSGTDRMSITPDGKWLYVPSFEKEIWNVVDAATGDVNSSIETHSGAHNTVVSRDGERMFLGGLRSAELFIADTRTHQIVQRAGPLSGAVRPFTVDGARSRAYVCVNNLLGFEIVDLVSGKKTHRVEVNGFKVGAVKRHGCPSHGIGLTPNEREVWVVDGANQRVHVFDNRVSPPQQKESIALREQPGWVTFSLDSKFAYLSTGEVVDTATKKIVATLSDEQGREVHSEKMVEIYVRNGQPVAVGDQFGVGRLSNELDATVRMLPELHLLEPIWSSPIVYRESVQLLQANDTAAPTARLAFPATEILAVHSATGERKYELGSEVTLDDDRQTLSIALAAKPALIKHSELFPPAGAPNSYRHRVGNPEQNMLYGPGRWFHDRQVEVTYRRDVQPWPGTVPEFAAKLLPRTLGRLQRGEPLTIGVSGDSISFGGDASGQVNAPPQMPPYATLVAAQLQATYKTPITLKNRAVNGWSVANGLEDLAELLAERPKLIILAYGMNDVSRRDPAWFKAQTSTFLERVHAADPEIEVLMVSPMLGHSEWVHTPREMFAKYRDGLAELVRPGVALADVTNVWEVLLASKHDLDLTGNGLNHPNDFGHRLYAQTVLALLIATPEQNR
jgi:acyl-CoA thioesterase-1